MATLCLSVSTTLAVTQARRDTVSRMELSATLQLSACLKYSLGKEGDQVEKYLAHVGMLPLCQVRNEAGWHHGQPTLTVSGAPDMFSQSHQGHLQQLLAIIILVADDITFNIHFTSERRCL